MQLRTGILSVIGAAALLAAGVWWHAHSSTTPVWTQNEIDILRSLWLGSLPELPADPTNAVADDLRAAKLGQRIFFDTRFSANGTVACATCHEPARVFSDGKSLAQGLGITSRNTMNIVGAAYSPWQFWDGRRDSLWSQALGPLEATVEHGGTRTQYALLIAGDESYRSAYESVFGPLPALSDRDRFPVSAGPVDDPVMSIAWKHMSQADRNLVNEIFANIGKAVAAYERLLLPGPSRFDAYVQAVLENDADAQQATLTANEIDGLRLFIGEAQCTRCHNGPLLTNNEFHNTGILSPPGQVPHMGRASGVRQALADPFNCQGPYSDGDASVCTELRFARTNSELVGAIKTPTLRNVADTGPYMHSGQLSSLADVLQHYNRAPTAMIGHNEAEPLKLWSSDLRNLEAFLRSLSGPLATPPEWLAAPDEGD